MGVVTTLYPTHLCTSEVSQSVQLDNISTQHHIGHTHNHSHTIHTRIMQCKAESVVLVIPLVEADPTYTNPSVVSHHKLPATSIQVHVTTSQSYVASPIARIMQSPQHTTMITLHSVYSSANICMSGGSSSNFVYHTVPLLCGRDEGVRYWASITASISVTAEDLLIETPCTVLKLMLW